MGKNLSLCFQRTLSFSLGAVDRKALDWVVTAKRKAMQAKSAAKKKARLKAGLLGKGLAIMQQWYHWRADAA